VTGWLIVAAALAVGDWVAVATHNKPLEYVCKPATMVALIGVALALDPTSDAARAWFVAALAFSMLGDVFLMLPSDRFVFGLGSFLLAHLAYIVGLNLAGRADSLLVVGVLLVDAVGIFIALRIVTAVGAAIADDGDAGLKGPVLIYIVAILIMVTSAPMTGRPLAVAGAVLFLASDATIAWNRFVRPLSWAPLFIIVTYHLGQAGLVLSLSR
jgi:uncharacterized membrane protein YhhN